MNERVKELEAIRNQRVNPDTGILEVCPKCGARPLQPCVNGRTHADRKELRAERAEFIYSKANYREIMKRRANNRIKTEKMRSGGMKYNYHIRGTKQKEKV